MKEKKKTKKVFNKGITLIALVITIIVLLILAGVSIATLTGDNGILTKAQTAKTETEKASEEEQLKLAAMNAAMHTQSYEYTTEDNKTVTIPAGFAPTQIKGENAVDDGLVIVDSQENSYVWIEVPKTADIYTTATINISDFTNDDYDKIYNDLKKYTEPYNEGSLNQNRKWNDEWYDGCGIAKPEDYNELKNKMLKSVYTNEGFWVGRYEMGTETQRKTSSDKLTDAVCKEGAYPYNFVTCSQAQQLAKSVNSGNYTSSLMFGIQWDLMLKFIETKNGKTQEELRKDSSSWGNYKNSTFTITKGKYSTNFGQTFKDVAKEENKRYTRPADENARVLLTPGIDKRFCVLNIYDIAGNIAEWTLEHALEDEKQPCAIRGGDAGSGVFAVAFRSLGNEETGTSGTGFRSTLY